MSSQGVTLARPRYLLLDITESHIPLSEDAP